MEPPTSPSVYCGYNRDGAVNDWRKSFKEHAKASVEKLVNLQRNDESTAAADKIRLDLKKIADEVEELEPQALHDRLPHLLHDLGEKIHSDHSDCKYCIGPDSKCINGGGGGSQNISMPSPLPLSDSASEDSDESEDSEDLDLEIPECPVSHDVGREMFDSIFPTNVDTLFTMLFTDSKFLSDFHASRKTFNIVHTDWQMNADCQEFRKVTFTVTLGNAVGPKVSHVTENQELLPVSRPGSMYAVDVEVLNGGIPFADSFYVTTHYCMSRVSTNETNLCVVNQIKFKRRVWGAKGMIERKTWAGMEDYYEHLERALEKECERLNLASETRPSTPDVPTKEGSPIQQTKSRAKRIPSNPRGGYRKLSKRLSAALLHQKSTSSGKASITNFFGAPGGSFLLLQLIMTILACVGLLTAFLYGSETGKIRTEK